MRISSSPQRISPFGPPFRLWLPVNPSIEPPLSCTSFESSRPARYGSVSRSFLNMPSVPSYYFSWRSVMVFPLSSSPFNPGNSRSLFGVLKDKGICPHFSRVTIGNVSVFPIPPPPRAGFVPSLTVLLTVCAMGSFRSPPLN